MTFLKCQVQRILVIKVALIFIVFCECQLNEQGSHKYILTLLRMALIVIVTYKEGTMGTLDV